MDWSQIVNVSFQGVLVLFTGVLAFATIALWRSTSRYADATKEMARSTELYVNISEELLRAERLDVVNRIHDRIYDEAGLKREYTLNNLAGSTSSAVSHDVAARNFIKCPFLFMSESENDYAHINADYYLRRCSYRAGGVSLHGRTVGEGLQKLNKRGQ